jgi:ParB family chromosome partitioning protein
MTEAMLFPTTPPTIQSILLGLIRPDPDQPRKAFDEESLAELAESIGNQGLLQPIAVRPAGDGTFIILWGERRWRACELAGMTEIPCLVWGHAVGPVSRKLIQVSENVHHRDLTDLEYVDAVMEMVRMGMPPKAIAESLGKRRQWVNLLLKIAQDPAVRTLFEMGLISGVETYNHFISLPPGARREKITSTSCARIREKYRRLEESRQSGLFVPAAGTVAAGGAGVNCSGRNGAARTSSDGSAGGSLGPARVQVGAGSDRGESFGGGEDAAGGSGDAPWLDDRPDKAESVLYVHLPREWHDEAPSDELLHALALDGIAAGRARGWVRQPALSQE